MLLNISQLKYTKPQNSHLIPPRKSPVCFLQEMMRLLEQEFTEYQLEEDDDKNLASKPELYWCEASETFPPLSGVMKALMSLTHSNASRETVQYAVQNTY